MVFSPEPFPPGEVQSLLQVSGETWTPLFRHRHSFPPEIFCEVMLNLIRNPNLNSNHLFRADILLDHSYFSGDSEHGLDLPARITQFKDFELKRVIVRTMIPRNILVDKPLDQTCMFHEKAGNNGEIISLVVYLPHISSATESPFYHPAVHGIGFLHSFSPTSNEGYVSIHYSFFDAEPRSAKLERTAQHLLAVLHKHGQGLARGYVKRVHHDVVLPQAAVQNTYARLKAKYSRALIQGWVEATDPSKHVFEDLGIAAFLIELWAEIFKDQAFPGFVDIGCGNGLLVHILIEEGYVGWGFDARRRKSWSTFHTKTQKSLKEMVLIPSIISSSTPGGPTLVLDTQGEASAAGSANQISSNTTHDAVTIHSDFLEAGIHNGHFQTGTFIISNHADELTPWTPILATMSKSSFIMIPCCSHGFNGSRFRAPTPKDSKGTSSAYASLVAWVSDLATACGWEIEKEMLRIPSTRNTALIGRHRIKPFEDVNVDDIISNNGGAAGWEANAVKLVKSAVRGH